MTRLTQQEIDLIIEKLPAARITRGLGSTFTVSFNRKSPILTIYSENFQIYIGNIYVGRSEKLYDAVFNLYRARLEERNRKKVDSFLSGL